jgi:alginate O-acetyltransferase complex protein AlgI
MVTFFVVVIGWVLFRSNDLSQATAFLKKMFSFSFNEYLFNTHLAIVLASAILISFIPFVYKFPVFQVHYNSTTLKTGRAVFNVFIIAILMTICVGELASSGFNPFIYFKF